MTKFNHYCAVLGVSTVVSPPELKGAYRRLMMQWHPDRHHNDEKLYVIANEKAKMFNEAYEYLSELLEESGGILNKCNGANYSRYDSYNTQHRYEGSGYSAGFPDLQVTEMFVKSSNIISIGYNTKNKVLYIKFKGNIVYKYVNVPESVFVEFVAADSHGRYAHRNIYRTYQYQRCGNA